jgi:glycosyltransferase involved in cell wall biosynthesis
MTGAGASAGAGRRLAFLLPDMGGGGAERVALRLIEDFVARGYPVDLLLLRAEGALLPLLPPEVRVVDLAAPRIRAALRPLIRYLRAERPFALQALMWPHTTLAVVARTLARTRTRLVLAEHTTLSRHYAHFGVLKRLLLGGSIALFYPRAEALVTVSEGSAADLARLSGLDRARFQVVYNPVRPLEEDAVAAPPPEIAAPNGPVILTVGSLKPEKNHKLLIHAFAKVAAHRDARLVIVGSGRLEEELKRFADQERVADRVIFPGFTTHPGPYYAAADLFVLSSDYEGYPLVLIEAMRAGLPIVSTDCESGPREILDGGRFGRLVPVGDAEALARAIEQALAEPAEAALLRDRAEALSGQETSDRYLALMLGSAG